MKVKDHIIDIQPCTTSRVHELDFDNIPFGRVFTDHMLEANYVDGVWTDVTIKPYGRMNIAPSISALHYGQAVFEGMKAYKNQAGEPVLFRPRENYLRMNHSARRMCMPEIPESIFMDGLMKLVNMDQQWIPTNDGSALYIRPLYFATDEYVGIRASSSYKFIIFCCPVGAYYPEPVGLMVTGKYVRAVEGGTGEAKAAGNYAASLLGGREAKAAGYDNILWLDARDHRYVEECGTMNVFFVIDGKAVTPPLTGTILRGTTRAVAMELLRDMGVEVEERDIPIDEVWDAHAKGTLQECFGAGTAATIAHVSRIGQDDTVEWIKGAQEIVLPPVSDRKIGPALLDKLNAIRVGREPDLKGWVVKA